jgi:proteasome lid subunit RPN8/RPN11
VGPTEIGAFGIGRPADLLCVEDIVLVQQRCTSISVAFADDAVADYFDLQIDAGKKPEEFARIWIHTHPGKCPLPSAIDEETFARVFGRCDWSVMCIVAQGGATYARLGFAAGPGGSQQLFVQVDYSAPFSASTPTVWEDEYRAHVAMDRERLVSWPPDPMWDRFAGLGDHWIDEFDVEFLDALSDVHR